MTAHENAGEFDQLDAYIHAADADALIVLAGRLDVEASLQHVLQQAKRQELDVQKPVRDERP